MIFTARQLEQLHKSNGHVTLPYRARLTPLAQDWIKGKGIKIGYSDTPAPLAAGFAGGRTASIANEPGELRSPAKSLFVWWCDGPCGPAKAAIVALEKESNLVMLPTASDPKQIVAVIRDLSNQIKTTRAAGGILLVQHGAAAMVFANRCPSIRAVLGTCLESVEQGVREVAANVLVIETPYKTLQQVRNLLSRFVCAKRELPPMVERQLGELASCG